MVKKHWSANIKRASKDRRTAPDGEVFDSLAEMRHYMALKIMEKAGEICNIRRQVAYPLILPDGTHILTPTGKTAKYTADFVFDKIIRGYANGVFSDGYDEVILEVKGHHTKDSVFRIAVFEAIYKKKVTIKKV